MRVAFLLEQLLAPVPGGTGRYSRELARAMAASTPDDVQLTGWTGWYRDVGEAVVPGLLGPQRLPLSRRGLAELWRRGIGPAPRADLVHAPTPLVPPPRRTRRLVATIHDAVPWTHPETLTPRGAAWHRDMGARIAADADAVVVPTRAVAEQLTRHLDLRRVEVVGEGVADAVAVAPPDAEQRADRLRLPERYALVVGTLEPRKGLDVAVAATTGPRWPEQLPLLVVGPTGWGDLQLPPGCGDRLRRLGRLSDEDLAVAYARASVVLVPSRSEGFGLPVIEAMTHGTPVVVSDVPALLEVAGGTAVPVPVGDGNALAEGVEEALRRASELAASGRRRASSFTWEAAAARCWDIHVSLA